MWFDIYIFIFLKFIILGDNNYIVLAAGTDFNDIEYNGVCMLNGLTFVNAPQSGEMRGIMFATKHEPSRSQIVVTGYPNCIMYKRSYWNGNWKNWETVYDTSLLTNSTMLGQLANALGARIDATHTINEGQHYSFGTGWFGLIRLTIVNTTTYATPAYIIVSGGDVTFLNRPWWIYSESDINVDSDGNLIIYNNGAIQTFYLTKIS